MTKVFVDASVIIAASYSRTGSSLELLRQAIRGQAELVIGQHVLDETERNVDCRPWKATHVRVV